MFKAIKRLFSHLYHKYSNIYYVIKINTDINTLKLVVMKDGSPVDVFILGQDSSTIYKYGFPIVLASLKQQFSFNNTLKDQKFINCFELDKKGFIWFRRIKGKSIILEPDKNKLNVAIMELYLSELNTYIKNLDTIDDVKRNIILDIIGMIKIRNDVEFINLILKNGTYEEQEIDMRRYIFKEPVIKPAIVDDQYCGVYNIGDEKYPCLIVIDYLVGEKYNVIITERGLTLLTIDNVDLDFPENYIIFIVLLKLIEGC